MKKIKKVWTVKEFYLSEIKEVGTSSGVSCPHCHNFLAVVSNGWFGGNLFYCIKEEKVFAVGLKDITKLAGEEFLSQSKNDTEAKNIRNMINKDNYKAVKQLLEDLK